MFTLQFHLQSNSLNVIQTKPVNVNITNSFLVPRTTFALVDQEVVVHIDRYRPNFNGMFRIAFYKTGITMYIYFREDREFFNIYLGVPQHLQGRRWGLFGDLQTALYRRTDDTVIELNNTIKLDRRLIYDELTSCK